MPYDRNDMRMALAQQLMGGTGMGPPRSIGAGLADVGTRLAGAMLARRTMDKEDAQRQDFSKMLSGFAAQPGAPGQDRAQQLAAMLSGSSNPMAQEAGQQLLVRSMLTQPKEETFGTTAQTVMGPEGPMLAQFGNRGTPRPVQGFGPKPEAPRAAADKWLNMGGGTFMNPDTDQTKFSPEAWQRELQSKATGASRTSVSVGGPQVMFPRPDTEKAADTAFGKGMGEMAGTLVQGAPQRAKETQNLNAMENLLGKLESTGPEPGKFAETKNELMRGYYAATGQKVPENVQDFQSFKSLVNRDILNFIGAGNGGIPASGFSDRDMKIVQGLAASASDDPQTIRAKLAVKRASIKADEALAKDIMDMRKTMPTETATYEAMQRAKSRDLLANEPAVQRWSQAAGASTAPAGPPPGPGMSATPGSPKKWRMQGGKLVPE